MIMRRRSFVIGVTGALLFLAPSQFAGRPVLGHMIDIARAIRGFDEVCIATSDLPIDDPSDVGETDPSAFELVGGVQPLKHAKELVRIPHIEADAVVANEDDDFVGRFACRRANLDVRLRARA